MSSKRKMKIKMVNGETDESTTSTSAVPAVMPKNASKRTITSSSPHSDEPLIKVHKTDDVQAGSTAIPSLSINSATSSLATPNAVQLATPSIRMTIRNAASGVNTFSIVTITSTSSTSLITSLPTPFSLLKKTLGEEAQSLFEPITLYKCANPCQQSFYHQNAFDNHHCDFGKASKGSTKDATEDGEVQQKMLKNAGNDGQDEKDGEKDFTMMRNIKQNIRLELFKICNNYRAAMAASTSKQGVKCKKMCHQGKEAKEPGANQQ